MLFLPGVNTDLFGDISVCPSLVQFQILPTSQHSEIKRELSPFPGSYTCLTQYFPVCLAAA